MSPRAPLPSQKPFQDLRTDIKVDVSGKFVGSNLVHLNENSSLNTTPCISSAGDATTSLKEGDVDHELLTAEQGFSNPWATYYGYYYPGYDACFGELDSHGYHVAGDDLNVQHAALQADDGSVVYFMPGYQAGYSPYVPVPAVGFDGKYITQSSMFPAHVTLLEYFPAVVTSEGFPSPHTWDTPFFVGNGMHGGDYNTVSDNMASKGFQSNAVPIKGKFFYPPSPVSIAVNGKGCGGSGKLKAHEANGFKNSSVPNDQNQACKTANAMGVLASGHSAMGEPGLSGENGSKDTSLVIRRDQYNLPDFPAKYDHALFFVIKSYSEDDVHKSIKYNVWASTPNGNKRLDCAFRDAQAKRGGENGTKCPVFLFFSVNASGQFCGVAEMAGPVDFMKKMDFWQQDKWNGFFPVKWHIVKDVPNPQLRHVILENNDNKPVTNSRDTQEVKFGQGMEMLQIFKRYVSKTSILDDFDFYESREMVMRDKRFRPIRPHIDLQKKVDEVVLGVRSVSISGPESADERAAEQRSHGAM